ncbi:MAG: zinc-finger domain-containing protein [Alphaproteobacteria bacterium]
MSTPDADPPETIEVDPHTETVGCDGGALGHPMVYYNFGARDAVDCGYCGRRFRKSNAGDAGGH